MKLELINKNQLKVDVEPSDILKWKISFDTLDYNDLNTKKMFWEVMEQARESTGFDARGARLVIEAEPKYDNSFSMLITKLDHSSSYRIKDGLSSLKKEVGCYIRTVIYTFDAFDDAADCCIRIKSTMGILTSTLYYHSGKYHLMLTIPIITLSQLDRDRRLYTLLSEYGSRNQTRFMDAILNEYGEKLIAINAIDTIKKTFYDNSLKH